MRAWRWCLGWMDGICEDCREGLKHAMSFVGMLASVFVFCTWYSCVMDTLLPCAEEDAWSTVSAMNGCADRFTYVAVRARQYRAAAKSTLCASDPLQVTERHP